MAYRETSQVWHNPEFNGQSQSAEGRRVGGKKIIDIESARKKRTDQGGKGRAWAEEQWNKLVKKREE